MRQRYRRRHSTVRSGPRQAFTAALTTSALLLAGCSSANIPDSRTEIVMWNHAAGNPEELATISEVIDAYNASQDQYFVRQEAFPQLVYGDAITAAALTGDLPCIVDIDGPIVPNWAWAELLRPLEISQETLDQMLPSTLGEYQDETYSVGYYDVALGIHARQSVLERYEIRIPSIEEPWSGEEFDAALETIAEGGEFRYPLDLGTGIADGEWWSYAYSPFLQSFGGDQIDRDTYLTAEGALNGPEAVAFGEWFQSLFARGLVSREGNPARPEFFDGSVALSWQGSWEALKAYEEWGDDMLQLPPPDFGAGPVIGGASWQWGVSTSCENPEGAFEYLEFTLQPQYLARFSEELGVIPATQAATELTPQFSEDGQLRPAVDLSREFAMVRPQTPAYQVISSVFEKTLKDIMHGADVEAVLNRAVRDIDTNIRSNDGYGF
ncbi:ABC transporter substrate-binding protein [Hoyosella subflava]|uniref:Extracellular solute-binding protein family 1 n=1 Tax=Hoyosella subflava (strain DSM 45089 / JCM 17490 / NBRC 109087 / DQS3-9A1) TaxID=443218 RepID=F6EKM9_HOYSD|nr:extracellular solute-binding protein [Hoyosella subflava]AEF40165.1 Extracellular solute-binding protein family 1 [Hoyosella subflava DQS3-9A1]